MFVLVVLKNGKTTSSEEVMKAFLPDPHFWSARLTYTIDPSLGGGNMAFAWLGRCLLNRISNALPCR